MQPPILDWFQIAMRLQHAKLTAANLSTDNLNQVTAKATIITEVDRLHWRIWNSNAKNAQRSIKRIRRPIAYQLPLADFSSISLTLGRSYTVEVSTPSMTLPTLGSATDSGVQIADSHYASGESYFVGWQGSTNISSTNGTYAFEFVPARVPEPTMISISPVDLVGIGVNRRVRRNSV